MPNEEESSASAPITHTDQLSSGAIVRLVIAAILLVAMVLFCASNTDPTKIDYLFGDTKWPLFVVIAFSAAAGAVLGVLASWLRHRRHRA